MRKWANSIISIAASTTRDTIAIYDLPASMIRTTHTRIDGKHFKQASQEQIDAFKLEFGITKPYFLLVGERDTYKHLEPFFIAVNLLSNELRDQFVVLTVGGGAMSEWEMV